MSTYRYRQYRAALKAIPFKGKFMPYDWGVLPKKLPFEWMPYSEMFKEFSQELANIVNDLTRYTHQLAAWRDVVDKLMVFESFQKLLQEQEKAISAAAATTLAAMAASAKS